MTLLTYLYKPAQYLIWSRKYNNNKKFSWYYCVFFILLACLNPLYRCLDRKPADLSNYTCNRSDTFVLERFGLPCRRYLVFFGLLVFFHRNRPALKLAPNNRTIFRRFYLPGRCAYKGKTCFVEAESGFEPKVRIKRDEFVMKNCYH